MKSEQRKMGKLRYFLAGWVRRGNQDQWLEKEPEKDTTQNRPSQVLFNADCPSHHDRFHQEWGEVDVFMVDVSRAKN
jgi:hypothetical protein